MEQKLPIKDEVDFVLDTLSQPLFDLPTHLYWESAYRCYERVMASLGEPLHPDIVKAQEKMKSGLDRLLKNKP